MTGRGWLRYASSGHPAVQPTTASTLHAFISGCALGQSRAFARSTDLTSSAIFISVAKPARRNSALLVAVAETSSLIGRANPRRVGLRLLEPKLDGVEGPYPLS